MEGHKGIVYQVKFSDDDEKIFSASDDGRLLVWEWKTGTILASFMRHSSAIRTFDFGHEARIVCGRNDGQMTTWDTSRMSHIDNILPDPDWEKPQESTDSSLLGWADETKHHTGSILCVKVSPNFRLLASGATDHTCKLWSIVSYMRDTDEVEQELEEAEIMREKLEKCIDILETSYDVQIPMRDFTGVKIGEVPIPLAFHADLLFTFCHDAPVLSVQFNSMSDIVITGSMDSTCRLWSARRGDLLFQINTPAPVSCLLMTSPSTLMCVCLNRVLTFEIKAHQKEEELPPYWQRKGYLAEMKLMAEDYAKMTNTDLETMEPMDDTVYRHPMVLFKPGEPGMIARGLEPQQKIHMPELRRLISHGLINPQFLETLLDQYKHIDSETLASNMKRHRMPVNQILKLLVNYNFHPKDILHMLSRRKNSDSIFDMIKQGRSITQYMISEGYKPVPDDDQDESNAIFLNYRDLLPPSEGHWGHRLSQEGMHAVSDYEAIDGIYGHGQGVVPRGQRAATNYDYIEEYDEEYDDESMYFQEGSRYMPPKGKIIHFIPSEQLKLLKDYQANRELKSIFLQQLVLDAHPVQFPNFNIESETVDRKPVVDKKTFPKSGIRFNESVPVPGRRRPGAQQTDLANRFDFSPLLTHGRGNARESQSTEGTQFYSPAPITRKFAKGSFSSSNTIFKPERQAQGILDSNSSSASPWGSAKRS
ncbi:WD40-repeat-containing domain protein [Polychytrium aggregatum]|uniref:WD40-repeat-containing domain protein n=1 Tax=Polychytrium aggregatum TaxID=110093 RepID=UPI0022FE92A0|nr:WD40-repeat-containing domain protein [Polychytrium aggregatum]KAI9203334.1 WD40-repeat-containing domain protein [Polychytrium aggregatum]